MVILESEFLIILVCLETIPTIMSAKKKTKFTDAEEEKIIDFVKTHEILFNAKLVNFRDTEAKNRLWLALAKELNKDGLY